jgi:hypothetical protein
MEFQRIDVRCGSFRIEGSVLPGLGENYGARASLQVVDVARDRRDDS